MKNEFETRGDITAIFLRHKGDKMETLIDTKDLEKASSFDGRWHARWDNKAKSYYVSGNVIGQLNKKVELHRFLTDAPEHMIVDHQNHNTLNNRRATNLMVVTKQQNMQNRKVNSNSSTGIRGVCFHKQINKYQARIKVSGKETHLGYFDDVHEAEREVIRARQEYMPYLVSVERGISNDR